MDPSPAVILAQFQILKNALRWDVDAVSKRNMRIREIDREYPISGHNGEWLGVLGGAWGAFLRYCTSVRSLLCVLYVVSTKHKCVLRYSLRFRTLNRTPSAVQWLY